MSRLSLFIALVLLGACFAAPGVAFAEDETRPQAPGFELPTLKGKDLGLSDLEGKVIVVNFWATWCGPCLQELPLLDKLGEKYKDDGLVVLAVATDGPDTLSEVRSIARRGRWKLTVLLDQEGVVAGLLNPRGTNPFTVFIDRKGRISSSHEGFSPGDEKEHEKVIKKLLDEE